jgi:alpha-D-ribose 1-methylphosphonate 5-phosphate C-P lyase
VSRDLILLSLYGRGESGLQLNPWNTKHDIDFAHAVFQCQKWHLDTKEGSSERHVRAVIMQMKGARRMLMANTCIRSAIPLENDF